MFRLLGFCVGSLTSIGALMLLIGMPDFHLGNDATDLSRYDAAVEKLKSKQPSLPPPAVDVPAETERPNDLIHGPEVLAEIEPASTREGASPLLEGGQGGEAPGTPRSEVVAVAEPDRLPVNEWHSFWTPFRSEIAARGFVGRLENVTGLDYRILKIETGIYEVAFSYVDPVELDTKLERISAATGLNLTRDLP